MKVFAQNLAALMPAGITLPQALINTFDQLEDQGCHHTQDDASRPEHHKLFLDPTRSSVTFGGAAQHHTHHWPEPNTEIDNRIAIIATTSSADARAAIWLDDAGCQQFVHIGDATAGVISDDPAVFLQFLATTTAQRPTALGSRDFTGYDHPNDTDPFVRWLALVMPDPSEDDLAYELELMKTVETLNIMDTDSSDTLMQKIGTLFYDKAS